MNDREFRGERCRPRATLKRGWTMEYHAKNEAIKDIVKSMKRFDISLLEIGLALNDSISQSKYSTNSVQIKSNNETCPICGVYRCTEHF